MSIIGAVSCERYSNLVGFDDAPFRRHGAGRGSVGHASMSAINWDTVRDVCRSSPGTCMLNA